MCRYLQHEAKTHWACLPCRWTSKHHPFRHPSCPLCRTEMVNLGRDFKAPRADDIRQWRKVEALWARGIRFDSCGCNGPGPRPATLAQMRRDDGRTRRRRREEAAPGTFSRVLRDANRATLRRSRA